MDYTWDLLVYFKPSLTGEGAYWLVLVRGVGWTVLLSLASWCVALLLAAGIGIMRTLPYRCLSLPAACFVSVFRNIPLLVQVFLWFYVFPEIIPDNWGMLLKSMNPTANQFLTVLVALSLFTAAKSSECVRSGILAVSVGQKAAGRALGMTLAQNYRYVILPQAARIILPPLTSDFLNVFKNSAVALTIGMLELTGRSRQMSEFSAQPFESFLAATALYMLITWLVILGMRLLERRLSIPGQP